MVQTGHAHEEGAGEVGSGAIVRVRWRAVLPEITSWGLRGALGVRRHAAVSTASTAVASRRPGADVRVRLGGRIVIGYAPARYGCMRRRSHSPGPSAAGSSQIEFDTPSRPRA